MESWNDKFVFTLYAYIYEMQRKEAFNNCVDIVLPSFDYPWKILKIPQCEYFLSWHIFPRFEGLQTHHKEIKKERNILFYEKMET